MMMRFPVVTCIFLWITLASAALPYRGADFSSLLLLESTNDIKYAASPTAANQPFEQILYAAGVNLARIRVMTSGTYDLSYALKLAKRAKAVGMDLMLDLFYDDSWADPGQQSIPAGWPTDLEGLVSQVYNYTYEVVEAFIDQGTPLEFVQIGNEADNGILWPTGQVSDGDFTAVSKLMHAGAVAVHAASPSTKRVIHVSSGWDKDFVSYFFYGIFSAGDGTSVQGSYLTHSDIDVMAVTFYPFWGIKATFENLKASMSYILSTYDKDIMIAETGWPVECDAQLLSVRTIPVSAEGQVEWIRDTAAVLGEVNYDHCGYDCNKALGVIYWEPGLVTDASQGTICADNLLVNYDGVSRSSMALFLEI